MSEPIPKVPAKLDKAGLLDWLLPHCASDTACVLFPQGEGTGPGWVQCAPDVTRAVAAFRAGTLEGERFNSVTRKGKTYIITGGTRLGLVPHHDGLVARFCLDYDGHDGQTSNVHLADPVDRFLGAQAIRFSSKSGSGLHSFYALARPMPVETFLAWVKAWGFNMSGDIELFPKTTKLSQVLLPNEPNDKGGDTYQGGTFESCVVKALPTAPARRLDKQTLDFLRGFVAAQHRNIALNAAAFHLGKKRVSESEARALCMRGAELCGLLAEEPEKTEATFDSGFRAGHEEAGKQSIDAADDLPQLDAGDRNLPRLTQAVWDAVVAQNEPPHLFRRAGQVVWIDKDDEGKPIIVSLDKIKFRHALARLAHWYRWKKHGGDQPLTLEDAAPPLDVVEDALALPSKPLPILDGLVEAPVFAPDGTLVTTPGYSPPSRLFYAPTAQFVVPPVSAMPSGSDIEIARGLIVTELLGDFPFTSETELAHAIALLLHPFVRPLIAGSTPLHLIEKPSPGTGASLLVDLLLYPSLGRPPATMTEGRDEDEWRKRLTAAVRSGGPAILIDNLRRRLDSSSVSAAITAQVWEDRILGTSDIVRLPIRWAWIATGNNPALSSEITRRTVRIRLDAKTDRPWLRQGFRHPDIRRWTAEHRADLVWAALTLAQNWLAKGRPHTSAGPTFGMFEAWSDVLGGILACAGIPGFLGNLEEFYECSDVEGEAWRNFVAAWFHSHGDHEVGVADLYSLASREDGSAPIDLGDGTEKSQKTRLGKALSAQRDRQFGAYQVVAGAKKDGAQQWKLHKAAEHPEHAEHVPPCVRKNDPLKKTRYLE